MKKVALTEQEMDNLISLGLDVSDASMFYFPLNDSSGETMSYVLGLRFDDITTETLEKEYPVTMKGVKYAYTIQDIMKKITANSAHLLITFAYIDEGVGCTLSTDNDNILYNTYASVYNNEEDIDAAYMMLLYCIEHNYVNTVKQ